MIAVSAQAQALLDAGAFVRRTLIKAELGGGTQGVWNDDCDVDFEGVTYKGLLNFEMSPVVGTSEGTVEGVTIRFAGLDLEARELVASDDWHQRPITIRRLYMHPETKAVLLVKPEFFGRIDAAQFKTGGDGMASLEVACESWDRDLQRVIGGERTSANQSLADPDDRFFEYVGDTALTPLVWGRK